VYIGQHSFLLRDKYISSGARGKENINLKINITQIINNSKHGLSTVGI
jgi:hypothetical protein